MVVIIYAYTGVLTSLLAAPKFEPTVESVEELVTRGNFRLTIEKKVILTLDFLVSCSSFTDLLTCDKKNYLGILSKLFLNFNLKFLIKHNRTQFQDLRK